METPQKMDWPDSEKYMPGALGSVAYFMYMKFVQGMDWKKALVALMTGILISAYLGPEVHSWMPSAKPESIGFMVGFMGMKVAEGFVSLDVKGVIKKTIEKPLK